MDKKIYSTPSSEAIEVSCEKIIATSISGTGEDSGGLNSNRYKGPFSKDENGWPN